MAERGDKRMFLSSPPSAIAEPPHMNWSLTFHGPSVKVCRSFFKLPMTCLSATQVTEPMTVVYLQTKHKTVNGKMYGDLVYARALH